mgnify:CR=1 FL=1
MYFLNDIIEIELNAATGTPHFIQYAVLLDSTAIYIGNCFADGTKNKVNIYLNDIFNSKTPKTTEHTIQPFTVTAVDLLNTTITTSVSDYIYFYNQPNNFRALVDEFDDTHDSNNVHNLLYDRCNLLPLLPPNTIIDKFKFTFKFVDMDSQLNEMDVDLTYTDGTTDNIDTITLNEYPIDNVWLLQDIETTDILNFMINGDVVANVDNGGCSRFYLQWITRNYVNQCQPFEGKMIYRENINTTSTHDFWGNSYNTINEVNGTWELNSGWIEEDKYKIYKDILTSSFCVLYDTVDNRQYAVKATNKSFTDETWENNHKLLNFTVNVEEIKKEKIYS